jgi:hypothetical protein
LITLRGFGVDEVEVVVVVVVPPDLVFSADPPFFRNGSRAPGRAAADVRTSLLGLYLEGRGGGEGGGR